REKAREPLTRRDPQPRAAAAGAHLEVVVGGDKAWWPCWVKEYGADGKAVGSVICDSTEILARTLSRIAKDANAPKDVQVSTQPGAPADRTKAVMDACQAAGFRQVRLAGRAEGGADIRIIGPDGIRLDPLHLDRLKGEEIDRAIRMRVPNARELEESIRGQVDRSLRAVPLQREQAIRALEEAE